jgi:hypothetical protein
MSRSQHMDISIQQSRHRVLCGILTEVNEGQHLIERARLLGFPVDWQDPRVYPNRPGYSDYGATFLLAKDVARAEAARQYHISGRTPDYLTLDALSSRQAQHEATSIFNSLRARGIELSGYANGRYFTAQPMPWSRPRSPAPAPMPVPPRSKRH